MRSASFMGRVLMAIAALLVGLCPAVGLAGPVPQAAAAWKVPPPPGVSAGAAILMDWQTGQILYQKNANQPRDPASTTKVLTAIIALERGKLSDKVKVSRRAAYTPGSSMYIKPGDEYSLHDLLHGLLLRSGNDAAVAIAEHLAGSVDGFAKLMNEKAKAIGAKNSHFTNPHGLTDARHVSTAYDLALITRYALQNETFRSIVSLREKTLTYEYLRRDTVLYNTNRLLSILKDVDGVKTGTTAAAGACLISSATRDDQKLVAVVLRAGDRWRDSANLLEWGFGNFRLTHMGHQGDVLLAAPVRGGKVPAVPLALSRDLPIVVPRKGTEQPRLEVQVQEGIQAPIAKGQYLGRATVWIGGKRYDEAVLTAARDVPKATLLDRVYRGLLPLIRWMND